MEVYLSGLILIIVNTEEPPNDDKGSANSTDDQSGDSDSECMYSILHCIVDQKYLWWFFEYLNFFAVNFVYEVNNEDKDSNEEDEGESNEGDSPTSSQSGGI